MRKGSIDHLAHWLMVLGALNWGLVGLFDFNIVDEIFGGGSGLAKAVYVLIGVSALWAIFGKMRKA